MIKRLEFENFKLLRKVRVDLQRFTLIAGPNSCGKTSLLRGVNLVTRNFSVASPSSVLSPEGPDAEKLETHGERGYAIRLHGEISNDVDAVGIHAARVPEKRSVWEIQKLSKESGKRKWSSGLPRRLGRQTLRSVFLRLDPRRLAQPSYGEWPEEFLKEDGTGLAAVLATLAATEPRGFDELKASARAIVPQLRDLQLLKAEKTVHQEIYSDEAGSFYHKVAKKRRGFRVAFDMQNAPKLRAEAVSEGTILTIGLLTVLISPERPNIVLLDNLETGLHPRGLGELVTQMRRVMERYPKLQIIATTHSPYLLDHFKPQEIRLMCSDDDGFAICGPLADHPDFKRWKDEMAPGEFWSMVGEDWLRPKASARKQ